MFDKSLSSLVVNSSIRRMSFFLNNRKIQIKSLHVVKKNLQIINFLVFKFKRTVLINVIIITELSTEDFCGTKGQKSIDFSIINN